MNYGFQKPEILPDQWILGGQETLQPDGQWDAYLPIYEPQFENGYDTYGCTVWGTQNAIEIFLKKTTGIEYNFSERFNYILAGVRPPGADPHHVMESVRRYGLIPNQSLPMAPTFEEFLKPDPMDDKLLAIGRHWKRKNTFTHSWVRGAEEMKKALQSSPLCVSVSAWYRDGDVYVDNGKPNNHWCVCFGWNDKGWKIFDSYDHSVKIYSFDSLISFCKSISVVPVKKRTFIDFLKELYVSIFN